MRRRLTRHVSPEASLTYAMANNGLSDELKKTVRTFDVTVSIGDTQFMIRPKPLTHRSRDLFNRLADNWGDAITVSSICHGASSTIPDSVPEIG